MNSIVSLFAGLLTLINSFFGHSPQTTIQQLPTTASQERVTLEQPNTRPTTERNLIDSSTTTQDALFIFIGKEIGKASGGNREAIERDHASDTRWSPDNFYETKSNIYFFIPYEKDGCTQFEMLNKNTKTYYNTSLSVCPNIPLRDTLPYYIRADVSPYGTGTDILYSRNLETGSTTEILRTGKDESLFAGTFGDFGFDAPSIYLQDKNNLTVGIFKQYKTNEEFQNGKKNEYGDIVGIKVRDVIVNFRTP